MVNLEHHTMESIEREIITKSNESEKRTLKSKKEITFKVAGITFNGIQQNIKSLVKEEKEIIDPYEGLSNKNST